MKKVTIKSTRAIATIGKLFACLPRDESTHWTQRILYPIFVFILNMCMFVFSVIGKFEHMKSFEATAYVLALGADGVLIGCTIIRTISVNFTNAKEHLLMQKHLRLLEDEQKSMLNKIQSENVLKDILIMNFGFLLNTVSNLALLTTSLPWFVVYYLLKEFIHYQLMISVAVLKNYIKIFTSNYKAINHVLVNLRPENFLLTDLGTSRFNINKINNQTNIELLLKQYMKLSFIIRQFNDVYGVYLVFIYVYIIINLLVPFNLALVYGGGQALDNGTTFGPYFNFLALLWCCLPWMIFRDLFLTGETMMNEIDKIPENCYRVMMKVPESQKNAWKELANETGLIRPTISANGWFEVNYKMILTTITMIISYLIVLIQYHG